MLRRAVAEQAADECADECGDAHSEHDAEVDAAGAQVADGSGQGGQAADHNVGAAGDGGGHPQQEHSGQAHRAEGEADEAAEDADQEGYGRQQDSVPDRDGGGQADFSEGHSALARSG